MFDSQDFVAASDYMVAWSVYSVAALVLLALAVRYTRRWQPDLRWLTLGFCAVLLLTPSAVPGHAVLAPAISFLALGALSGNSAAVLAPVLVKLALLGGLVVTLVAVQAVWRRGRQSQRQGDNRTPVRSAR